MPTTWRHTSSRTAGSTSWWTFSGRSPIRSPMAIGPNAELVMDEYGRLLPAPNRFPSAANGKGFKPLADYVHALGLKFGIHIMRGIPRRAVDANVPVFDSSTQGRRHRESGRPSVPGTPTCSASMSAHPEDATTTTRSSACTRHGASTSSRPTTCWAVSSPATTARRFDALSRSLRASGRPIVLEPLARDG